jgi:hypothetical protein
MSDLENQQDVEIEIVSSPEREELSATTSPSWNGEDSCSEDVEEEEYYEEENLPLEVRLELSKKIMELVKSCMPEEFVVLCRHSKAEVQKQLAYTLEDLFKVQERPKDE